MITRAQIRQWARTGQLTQERIAAVEAAQKTGQVSRDSGVSSRPQPLTLEPQQPRVGGTEIAAQRIEVREPKHQWFGWAIELERARRRGDI